MPYEPGDYLTDGVLDLLYPGYQDSSYFHDERGFMTATPYGDGTDCILSDAPTWLLRQYAVVIDWRYLQQREKDALQAEAGWLRRQGLALAVDLASGVNLYPDLRLVDNSKEEYAASMNVVASLLEKMEILGSHDLILSLHRQPENNFTIEQTRKSFVATLKALCQQADKHAVTLHLRLSPGKPPRNVREAVKLFDRVAAANLRLAPSTGLLLAQDAHVKALRGKVGLWLMSGSRTDLAGKLWDTHAPLAEVTQKDKLAACLAIAPKARFVLDAIHDNQDDEYRDARALADLVPPNAKEPVP